LGFAIGINRVCDVLGALLAAAGDGQGTTGLAAGSTY
jgi:hypothetical protein